MNNKLLYAAGRTLVSGYANMMLDMDVVQAQPMPDGARIIAANHPTTIDPFLVLTLLRTQTHILITESVFKIPVFGKILLRSGHIPVVVKNGRAAFEAAARLLHEGSTVAIFPEGALSPAGGGVLPARTGAVRLALETHAPVIPVGIYLLRERVRTTRVLIDGAEEDARWYLRGPYAMTVGAPLHYRGDVENWDEVRRLSHHLMFHIAELARQSEKRLMRAAGWATALDTSEFSSL